MLYTFRVQGYRSVFISIQGILYTCINYQPKVLIIREEYPILQIDNKQLHISTFCFNVSLCLHVFNVLCSLKSMYAENKKQALTLPDILAEFEINQLGKLMFRTVDKSFFHKGQTDIASEDIRYIFQKKIPKIYTNF